MQEYQTEAVALLRDYPVRLCSWAVLWVKMARDCELLAMAVSPSLVSGEHPEIWGGEAGGDRKQLWCPNLGQNNCLTFRPSADFLFDYVAHFHYLKEICFSTSSYVIKRSQQ